MRILLVDDEPSLVSLLGQFLTRNGHEVQSAGTKADAIVLLSKPDESFDAAVIDLTLPDGTGEEVAKEFALQHPAARIVIATGYDYSAPSEAWTVLQKPFLPRALLNILG
ncbi:hypothetical protein F183_A35650 [Bryobacterales bacterium F-183]|nr:hypothetical protein F183_A35650 [Bryobacterales bacterium F-183]